MSRGKRLGISPWVVVVGLVAMVVVGGIVAAVNTASGFRPSPEPIVQGYLDALSDGDSVAAAGYVDPAVGPFADDYPSAEPEVLTADVALAATTRITEARVVEVRSRTSLSASVQVSFRVGSTDVDELIHLEWDDHAATWRILDPLIGALDVDTGAPGLGTIMVGTIEVANNSDDGDIGFLAYPGVYRISGPGLSEVEVVVIPGDVTFAQLDPLGD